MISIGIIRGIQVVGDFIVQFKPDNVVYPTIVALFLLFKFIDFTACVC
jgi:hypothetical protein